MYQPIQGEIFHVHTKRCQHAGDYPDEAYIEKAIELGASRIVFSDHAPFPGDPFGHRMKMEQLPEYIDTMRRLKTVYQDKIEILCGLEVEYLPGYSSYIESLRNMEGIDVMLLGQHMYELPSGEYSFSEQDKSMEFKGLFQAMILGIESGCFDVVAHPDRAFRRRKTFGEEERTAARSFLNVISKHKEIYLEHNFASMNHRHQFWPEFWNLLHFQPRMLFGFDAHSPEELKEGWEYLKGKTENKQIKAACP